MSSIAAAPNEPDASKSGSRLARSAGIIGLATMTSRVLGLVREQVLPTTSCRQRDGRVCDRVSHSQLAARPVCGSAMSAAFVPTFTRQLTLSGKPRAWQLGNNVMTAIIAITIPL